MNMWLIKIKLWPGRRQMYIEEDYETDDLYEDINCDSELSFNQDYSPPEENNYYRDEDDELDFNENTFNEADYNEMVNNDEDLIK